MTEANTTGLNKTGSLLDSFGGGWGSFIGGITDTFQDGLGLALQYEQLQQARDSGGQSQSELVNSVTRESQPNATPSNAEAASGVGVADGASIDTKTMAMIGGGVVLLLLLIKR